MHEHAGALLRRYAENGDERAFAEFVRCHVDVVYSAAARRLGPNAHLAEDVAQEVLVKAAREARSLARHPSLVAWLYTATRNAALNAGRGETRRRIREREAVVANETMSAGAERRPVWNEIAPLLDAAIDRLRDRDRTALLLRFFEQRSLVQVGRMLGVSEDAARMRVDRALEKLRQTLVRRGVVSSGAALEFLLLQHTVQAAPVGLARNAAASVSLSVPSATTGASGWGWASGLVAVFVLVGASFVAVDRTRVIRMATAQIEILTATPSQGQTSKVMTRPTPPASALSSRALPSPTEAGPARRGGGRKAQIRALYDPMYRELGLTLAQIEAFETLKAGAAEEVYWTYELRTLPPVAAIGSTSANAEEQLQALLGPAGYERLHAYERLAPARALAAELASVVYLDEPLAMENADRFAQLVAGACGSYRAGEGVDRATIEWGRVLREGSAFLTPGQLRALRALWTQEQFQRALVSRLDAERRQGDSTTAGGRP